MLKVAVDFKRRCRWPVEWFQSLFSPYPQSARQPRYTVNINFTCESGTWGRWQNWLQLRYGHPARKPIRSPPSLHVLGSRRRSQGMNCFRIVLWDGLVTMKLHVIMLKVADDTNRRFWWPVIRSPCYEHERSLTLALENVVTSFPRLSVIQNLLLRVPLKVNNCVISKERLDKYTHSTR